MSLDMAFQIALGIAAFLGGIWVNTLRADLADLKRQLEAIRRDYQRRDDAEKASAQVIDMLRDVKTNVQRIEDKLDRKADK
ncbi:phosphatidylinositol-specific phospholipase C1-like protein [Laribacter hongkongensis]|uniref:phosphatidylinositol-specific phospholipase C1-like protein n=1 Tax=Laribacter hongkongensis TaxID=168471 RepID=UPI001EFD274E|nr:phosphatidylinositol-specific phospholipase C1-like protein [Laribacter hongkongensis]MCG9093416.1 phosphatidylinositol-specific phospholipase C1-like protein [Laribacter hongkongensis]